MSDVSHTPPEFATTLDAEKALLEIFEHDRAVLAERDGTEAAIIKEEMRANMRARALERAAINRAKKSKPVVSPTKTCRRKHG